MNLLTVFSLIALVASVYTQGSTVYDISNTTDVTTDDAKNVTTTVEPPKTTTLAPTTKPTPEPTPEPTPGNWVVNKTGEVCIVAKFSAEVKVNYTDAKSSKFGSFAFPGNATVDETKSNCNNATQTLALNFAAGSLTLVFTKESDKVVVEQITIVITDLKSIFPDSSLETKSLQQSNLTLFQTATDHSYYCSKATETTFSDGSSISFSDIQIEGYKTGTDSNFSLAEDCDGDVSNIVPIAVGCALAALVVIVLIAYLVGRRHKRQRGYESV